MAEQTFNFLGDSPDQLAAASPAAASTLTREQLETRAGRPLTDEEFALNQPSTVGEPTVESSQDARDITDKNIKELQGITDQQQQAQDAQKTQDTTQVGATGDTRDDAIRELTQAVGIDTPEEQQEVQKLMQEFNLTEVAAANLMQDPAGMALLRQSQEFLASDQAEIDALKARLDGGIITPETQNLINNIEATYKQRIAAQADLNKKVIAGTNVRGFRTGRTRYASEVQAGILGDVERRAMTAIQNLESERDRLIAEAKAAQNEEDFGRLNDLMGQFRKSNMRRLEALSTLNSEANKNLQIVMQQRREIEAQQAQESQRFAREAVILDLVSQGATDPAQIFEMLNFDEQGNQRADISLEEITNVLDNAIRDVTGEDYQGSVGLWQDAIASGAIPPDMDFFEFLRQEGNAKRKPSDGDSPTDTDIITDPKTGDPIAYQYTDSNGFRLIDENGNYKQPSYDEFAAMERAKPDGRKDLLNAYMQLYGGTLNGIPMQGTEEIRAQVYSKLGGEKLEGAQALSLLDTLIADNPEAPYSLLFAAADEGTTLSQSAINSILAENGIHKPKPPKKGDDDEMTAEEKLKQRGINVPGETSFNPDLGRSKKGQSQVALNLQFNPRNKLPQKNIGENYVSAIGPITAYGSSAWKPGLDIDLKKGDPLPSPVNGTVIALVDDGNKGFGKRIKIRDENGNEVWLSHLDRMDVKEGDKVRRGTIVGAGGNSGFTIASGGGDGSHLDLTVRKPDGSYLSAKEVEKYVNFA